MGGLTPRRGSRKRALAHMSQLRMLVAFDSDVANAVFRIATSAIFAAVESMAAEDGVLGTPAGVLHLQRFSDGGMLNVHGHVVISDGVFGEVPSSGRSHQCDPGLSNELDGPTLDVLFRPTRAPTLAELADVAMAIEQAVRRYLMRRARENGNGDAAPDTEAARARDVLERLARAKPVAERTASGEGPAGSHSKPAIAKLAARSPSRDCAQVPAHVSGFDVHAGVAIPAHARTALEKLLAYLARPPVPASRLRLLKNGNVAFDLKRTWARGVKTMEFQPLAFIARLAAPMPPPKFPMLRYLGVISAHARLRPRVLPDPPREAPERPISPKRPGSLTCAQLLVRTFGLRVTDCPCGGTFRFIAVIEEPNAIQLVAGAIIASGHLPRHRAPRGPPARTRRAKPNAAPRSPREPRTTRERPR
jgi:hypothetical protein